MSESGGEEQLDLGILIGRRPHSYALPHLHLQGHPRRLQEVTPSPSRVINYLLYSLPSSPNYLNPRRRILFVYVLIDPKIRSDNPHPFLRILEHLPDLQILHRPKSLLPGGSSPTQVYNKDSFVLPNSDIINVNNYRESLFEVLPTSSFEINDEMNSQKVEAKKAESAPRAKTE
jgi:hypothetical protein